MVKGGRELHMGGPSSDEARDIVERVGRGVQYRLV